MTRWVFTGLGILGNLADVSTLLPLLPRLPFCPNILPSFSVCGASPVFPIPSLFFPFAFLLPALLSFYLSLHLFR